MPKRTPAERFWAKVDVGDCWEWTGPLNVGGYGQFSVDGTNVFVHRFAYELLVGPIPDGLTLDHLCVNPPCVNPDHLEPVTIQENVGRGARAKRRYCPHGHPYIPSNMYIRPSDGGRECLVCRRAQVRRYKRRRKAKT